MRVLIINTVCGTGSTGKICGKLAKEFLEDGHEVRIAYGRGEPPIEYRSITVPICQKKDVYINAFKARLLDNEGLNGKKRTEEFIEWAEEYSPDLLWLHNLHGYYIHIEKLFRWIKSRPQMEVRWTLHDCWAFTGHCPYFSKVECDKWKVQCERCPQKKKYPASFFIDHSRSNYARKKEAFMGVKNMTIITPSVWLAEHVKQSFLGEYPVQVVHNTINTQVFCPTEGTFRKRYGLQEKYIILGVASIWEERKGLNDFLAMSRELDDRWAIVLVGLSRKQMKKMPSNVVCIEKTESAKELAEIYTAADVFVNPSREETFGMTTLEAMVCGTFSVVYKNTACEEVVNHYGPGIAVEHSVAHLIHAVKQSVSDKKR